MRAFVKLFAQRVYALCIAILEDQERFRPDIVSAAKSLKRSAERIIDKLK